MNKDEIAGFSWRAPQRVQRGWLRDVALALAIVLAASLLCRLGAAYWPARSGGVHRAIVLLVPGTSAPDRIRAVF